MLFLLKTFHLFVWLFVVGSIFYILYAGITNQFNFWLLISFLIVASEGIVLIANKWNCPLSKIARKYTENRQENFDIHLPLWLAKHHRKILLIIFILGAFLVLFNLYQKYF